MKSINVNKCTEAGGTMKFWVADWFALMNDKMGGDLDKIQVVGHYLVEVWKACGMNLDRVQFIWTSESIEKHASTKTLLMNQLVHQMLHSGAIANSTNLVTTIPISTRLVTMAKA